MAGLGSPPTNEILKLGLAGKAIPDEAIRFFAQAGQVPLPLIPGGTLAETVGPSRNYRINALVAILLNRWNGFTKPATSTMYDEAKVWAWLEWYIGAQCDGRLPWCAGEGDAGVYTHTFLVPIRALRGLALAAGGRASVVAACDAWLRVFAVHNAAIFSAPWLGGVVKGGTVPYAPQPGVIWICDQKPDAEMAEAGVASALVGPRTVSDYNTGRIKPHLIGLRDSVADAVRELVGKVGAPNELTAALKRAGFDASWPLTPAQLFTLRAAHNGDPSAKAECVGWVKSVTSEHEAIVEYCDGGVQAWMPTVPAGSTCPCEIHQLFRPPPGQSWGMQVVAIANDGRHDAKGGADTIGPATVIETATSLSTMRTDNAPGAKRVTVPKVGGRVLSRVAWGQGGHRVEIGGGGFEADQPTLDGPLPVPEQRPRRRGSGDKMMGVQGASSFAQLRDLMKQIIFD